MWRAFYSLLSSELTVLWRRRSQCLQSLIFYLLVVCLFPLAVTTNRLAELAPGIIWVAALLSILLGLDRLFQVDFSEGTLITLLLSDQPLSLLVLAKVLAHWLWTGLPLMLATPLLAIWLHLPSAILPILLLSLLLGTPILSLIGGIGVALTVGLRGAGMLLVLLVLPLCLPVLIFAVGLVLRGAAHAPVGPACAWLGALLCLSLALAPWAMAAALRVTMYE